MKKGFTLVELLAVIAILAILVIIALPNVMGMFNTAKENSFKTEVKEIYKTAEQTWINDAMFNSGVKEYSRCKSGCSNSLDLTGRSELEYYIKLNQSGEVIKYYATDGTFQYSYEGNGLSISDIESKGSFKKIAEITDENEKVTISNNKAYYGDGSCNHKLIIQNGSFSPDKDEKEMCIDVVDDGYVYQTYYFESSPSDDIYIQFPFHYEDIPDGAYMNVYEDNTKSNLIKTFTKSDYKPDRYSISENKFVNDEYTTFKLGNYNKTKIYTEFSDNLIGKALTTYSWCSNSDCTTKYDDVTYRIYSLNKGVVVSTSGPWITDNQQMEKIKYYIINNGKNFSVSNCFLNDNGSETCGNNYYIHHYEVTY